MAISLHPFDLSTWSATVIFSNELVAERQQPFNDWMLVNVSYAGIDQICSSYTCFYVSSFLTGYCWVCSWALVGMQKPEHVPENPKHSYRGRKKTGWIKTIKPFLIDQQIVLK